MAEAVNRDAKEELIRAGDQVRGDRGLPGTVGCNDFCIIAVFWGCRRHLPVRLMVVETTKKYVRFSSNWVDHGSERCYIYIFLKNYHFCLGN